MTEYDIREGDIVIIDYIDQFTHENIYGGKALVIWKWRYGQQPLIMRLNKEGLCLTWSCYEYFTKVIGHIDLSNNLKELCKQALDGEVSK